MMRIVHRASWLSCLVILLPTQLGALELQQPPAVVTDVPEAVDLSYALPENWLALPPAIDFDLRAPSPPLLPTEVDLPPTELAALR